MKLFQRIIPGYVDVGRSRLQNSDVGNVNLPPKKIIPWKLFQTKLFRNLVHTLEYFFKAWVIILLLHMIPTILLSLLLCNISINMKLMQGSSLMIASLGFARPSPMQSLEKYGSRCQKKRFDPWNKSSNPSHNQHIQIVPGILCMSTCNDRVETSTAPSLPTEMVRRSRMKFCG